MRKKNVDSRIAWIVLLGVSVIAFSFWFRAYQAIAVEEKILRSNVVSDVRGDARQTNNQENNLKYTIDFGSSKVAIDDKVDLKVLPTVLAVLEKISADKKLVLKIKDYTGLGKMVTQIGELENGQNNKYWQYSVNGKMPSIGADAYKLKSGDLVEWRFSESSF